MDSAGLHLVRSVERVEEIDELADVLGGRVGLAAVAESLNRSARVVRVRASAASFGFRWDGRDTFSPRWWPQGITSSADADDSETVLGRPWLVTSAYSKALRGVSKGARVTFVDVSDRAAIRYRHVLLVEPFLDGRGRVEIRPVRVHAGGIVWHGSYLHVAATTLGFCTFRLGDVMAAPPGNPSRLRLGSDTFGYRFVLPLRFRYDAGRTGDVAAMRYSFLSLDRSLRPPELLAGEYGTGRSEFRLVHFGLDPRSGLLARTSREHAAQPRGAEPTGAGEVSAPLRLPLAGVERMQGAVVVDGRYHVTTSAGRFRRGSLWIGRPGALREHRGVVPAGPEDVCYWPSRDELWSLTEHLGRRYVFAIPRSRFR